MEMDIKGLPMKNILSLCILFTIIIIVSGCTSATNPAQVNQSEKDAVLVEELENNILDLKCSASGEYPLTFGYHGVECKDIQKRVCTQSTDLYYIVLCLSEIALFYKDETLCEPLNLIEIGAETSPEIRERGNKYRVDSYWGCKAIASNNQKYCSSIGDKGRRNSCIKQLGGTSILNESDCKERGVFRFEFKYCEEECKTIQIKICKELDSEYSSYQAAGCFSHMAEGYDDESLCNYINRLNNLESDEYWYCKAKVTGNRDYCAYIERSSKLDLCLRYA